MPNESHRIRDVVARKEYPSKAAAGRDLAHLVSGDPRDQFVWFQIARAFPDRFRVLSEDGKWVRLDDPSAPAGTLRPKESALAGPSKTRLTTIEIDEEKLDAVKAFLGTSTLRETVDRSFDEVLVRAARQTEVERLRRMEGLDLDKASVMRDAWR
jgi:Arc/MetJ family transcription regulator